MNKVENTQDKIKLSNKAKDYWFVLSVCALPLISFAIFYVYMNFNSFTLAFKSIDIFGKEEWIGFSNFKDFLTGLKGDNKVGVSIKNSFVMHWLSFFISMPLYFVFSYYIYKKNFGSKIFLVLVMLPNIVSSFVYALVYKKMVEVALPDIMTEFLGFKSFPNLIRDPKTAFGNNVFYTVWLSFGTSTLVYTNAMRAIDDQLIESAQIDGANNFNEFFHIIMPLIWPTVTTFVVTGAGGMFTASGALVTFYMWDAPPEIWGFGYYITRTVKLTESVGYSNYPMVAASGLCITIVTAPVVFLIKGLMDKLDKTEG